MGVVVAVDAGTTGVRAMAVGEDGRPRGWSYREFPQHYPRPGWVEHDPGEIWAAVEATLDELLAGLDQPVAALGIVNQRETVVAWDRRTGRPLHRAIVWQDRRTAARCDQLGDAGHLPLVRERTGLVLDPYFSASKLEWLLTEGGVEAGPHLAVGTIDSWLLWKLTGVHATDPSNASRTLLFAIGRMEWSDELCDLFGVPAAALPEVVPSSGRVGRWRGIPVSGMAGDQQAALFGQACFEPGMAKNTYGTGSFVLLNAGPDRPPAAEGLLTTVAWALPGRPATYAVEGAVFVTGAALSWLRDGLGIVADVAEIGPLAAGVRDTEGVYLVPAFTGLGSPWWDPWARGTVVGLTRGAGRAHLARAAVEAMAYQTRDVVEAMHTALRQEGVHTALRQEGVHTALRQEGVHTVLRQEGVHTVLRQEGVDSAAGRPLTVLRVDGGASVLDLLLQLQADQLRVPVARPVVRETTALGAAWLAGLAEGVWSSTAELADLWELDAEFTPRSSTSAADRRHAGWRRAVERSRGWAGGDG